MNGPRTLSDSHLSHLNLAIASEINPNGDLHPYHLLITAPHFIGDGISLHKMAQELLILLSNTDSLLSTLEAEIPLASSRLPLDMESQLPKPRSLLQSAVQNVEYQLNQAREIGGQTIDREQRGKRKTVLIERSFDVERTKRILTRCKKEGVSISNAAFALIAIAWARVSIGSSDPSLPT
jgi:hypothetical protein